MQTFNSFNELVTAQNQSSLVSDMSVFNATESEIHGLAGSIKLLAGKAKITAKSMAEMTTSAKELYEKYMALSADECDIVADFVGDD